MEVITSYPELSFLICALVIFFAGKKLSYYGDLLAEKSGMGKALLGLVLMSAVTSLPELVVGFSACYVVGSADLAMGDILGSCAFNLALLSVMDVFMPRTQPLLSTTSQSHVLAASLGIILMALCGLGIWFNEIYKFNFSIGFTSLSFALIYFISLKILFDFKKNNIAKTEESNHEHITLSIKKILLRYFVFAVIIVVTASLVPSIADELVHKYSMNASFVGTLFIAVSTSLPEAAVSIAAVRLGATDMAVGNLFGSNIFNMFILFMDDVFYRKGYLFHDASDINLISVFFVMMMSAVAILGLLVRIKEKKFRYLMAWDTMVIFILYVINMFLLNT